MFESFWKSEQWTSVNIAMAACPQFPGKCPGDKERIYTSTDETHRERVKFTQFTDFTDYYFDDTDEHQDYDFCTYKITATTGAPGFNMQSDIASNEQFKERKTSTYIYDDPTMYASWVEYDAMHLSPDPEYGTWPPRYRSSYNGECGDNCVQGSLHPRAVLTHEGELSNYPSEKILTDF